VRSALLVVEWLVIPAAIGLLAVRLVMPRRGFVGVVESFALGLPLGLGLTGVVALVSLLLFDRPGVLLEIITLVVLVVLVVVRSRLGASTVSAEAPASTRWLGLGAVVCLCAVLLADAATIHEAWITDSHGLWDAWAMWNMRARMLARGGADWSAAFAVSPELHPDYPLLLPAIVARGWTVIGTEARWVPALVGLVFASGSVACLLVVVRRVRGDVSGVVAAITVAATPLFVGLSASQYAEAPLAFFVVFGLAQLTLLDHDPTRMAHALLAGLAFGLALLTKNEGSLLVLCVVLVRAALLVRLHGRSRLREVGWVALGIAAPIALLVSLRAVLTPDAAMTDIRVDGWAEVTTRLADVNRYEVVGRYLLAETRWLGDWPVPVATVLGALALARGRSHGRGAREARGTVIGSTVLYVLGISVVYVAGSSFGDRLWDHVESSLPRLMMSAWPMIVLGLFVGMRDLSGGAGPPVATAEEVRGPTLAQPGGASGQGTSTSARLATLRRRVVGWLSRCVGPFRRAPASARVVLVLVGLCYVGALVLLRSSHGAWLERAPESWAASLGIVARGACLVAGLVLMRLFSRPPRALPRPVHVLRGAGYAAVAFLIALCLQAADPVAIASWAALVIGAFVIGVFVRSLCSPSHRLLRTADVLLTNLCLCAVGAELGVRILGAFVSSPLLMGADSVRAQRLLASNTTPGVAHFGDRLNSWGDNDRAPVARRPGECLAVTIGDSFSIGMVPHSRHFTTVAERRLRGCEIYNMGASGIGPLQYLQLLRTHALELSPNAIVIDLYVGNDIAPEYSRDQVDRPTLDRERLRTFVVGRRLVRWLAEKQRLGAGRVVGAPPGIAAAPGTYLPWLDDYRLEAPTFSEQTYLDLQARIARRELRLDAHELEPLFAVLAQMRQAASPTPLLVLLIPAECQVDDRLWRAVTERARVDVDRAGPQRKIGAWLGRQHIPYVDLLPILRAAPREADGRLHVYHLQDTHLNAKGNRIAGEALADLLRPYLPRGRPP